jgi:hypothetical protein
MTRLCLVLLVLGALMAAGAKPADKEKPKGLVIDKARRTITVPARVAPRKINDPRYKEIYPIEVIATYPFPKGKKAHETVVTFDVKPSEVHKALVGLGLKPGNPAGKKGAAKGPEVKIFLEVPSGGKSKKRIPIENVLVDPKTLKKMPKVKWLFTGSVRTKPDPDKDETVYGADLSGTLIAIFPVTDETVFQSTLTMKEEKYVKLEVKAGLLPAVGKPVNLVIVAPKAK